MIFKSVISGLCILVVIYGIAVKSRRYFNIGYFVFGIFIVFDQLTLFASSNDINHLALAAVEGVNADIK